MTTGDVAIVILAAGASSRMNGPSKQTIIFDGQTLLERCVDTARSLNPRGIHVVVGARSEEHTRLLNDTVNVVYNDGWERGIGSSIKLGISEAFRDPRCLAAIIMVCDQPLLSGSVIRRIFDQRVKTGKPVVASFYAGRPGVPALFDRSMLAELMRMPDHTGAKMLMESDPSRVTIVDFPDGDIDIDTPEDLKKLSK